MAAAGASLERAGEGRGKEREGVERAGELGSLYLCTARRRAGGHASSEGATRPAAPASMVGQVQILKNPILPQKYD